MSTFDRADSLATSGSLGEPRVAADPTTTATGSMPVLSLSAEPEPVLVTVDPRTRRFDRDDVVVRKGEIALVNGHYTPHESMAKDLVAVHDALEQAGIDFLLVRGDHNGW